MAQVEILAPAGSMESFKAAINAGADALYFGGNLFGARAYANNFDENALIEAIDYAHIHKKKAYLTVNTLLKDDELNNKLYSFLAPLYEVGLDAVIVQDFGVFQYVKEHFPKLDIHASTQMTCNGYLSAKVLQEMGASRVVTSRELSASEIKEISKETSLEIESFVHGALCYCYSGQCLMSSMIGGRSGNRGRCAQPCRLSYSAYDCNNKSILDNKHIISPKDMCSLSILPDIIDAGVYSLKIEGRMKSPEYTAGVVSIYRKYVDKYLALGRKEYRVDEKDINDLMDLFNRGNFTSGYYNTKNGPSMMSTDRPNHQGTKAVEVISCKNSIVRLKALEKINSHDVIEFTKDFNWTSGVEYDVNQVFEVRIPRNLILRAGNVYYRIRNNKLIDSIREKYIDKNIKEDIAIRGYFAVGKEAKLTASVDGNIYTVYGNVVEEAKNCPTSTQQITKQLSKLGSTEFRAKNVNVEACGNIFISVNELNELRRSLVADITKGLVIRRELPSCENSDEIETIQDDKHSVGNDMVGILTKKNEGNDNNSYVSVLCYSKEQVDLAVTYKNVDRIYLDISEIDFSLLREISDLAHNQDKKIFMAFPHILRKEHKDFINKKMHYFKNSGFDGYLIRNLDTIKLLDENGLKGRRIADYQLYQFNSKAREFFEKYNIDEFTVSPELSYSEVKSMDNSNSELVVYGYQPVMISAQCVMKNLNKCVKCTDKENSLIYLEDRTKARFSVVNKCSWCYNIVYNALVTCLFDLEETGNLNTAGVRIDLALTSLKDSKFILDSYFKNDIDLSKIDYTRGRFLRGVE